MSNQATFLNADLYDYLLKHSVRFDQWLLAGNKVTDEQVSIPMQSSLEELNFLGWFTKTMNANRIIEIGTFTGLSALAMAQNMADDGQIICIDHSEEFTQYAKKLWVQAGVATKIELRLGEGLPLLKKLSQEFPANSFDLIFIDADKSNYPTYYELALSLIRAGGVIMIDNVLWQGAVTDPSDQRPSTKAIRILNDLIYQDSRVDITILPIGDGLTLARKRGELK
jgi:predicted O-methyltransferase YrrM